MLFVNKTNVYSICSLCLYFIEKSLNVIPSATDKIQIMIKKEKENIVIIGNYSTNFTPSFLVRLKLLYSFFMFQSVLYLKNIEFHYDINEEEVKVLLFIALQKQQN